MEYNTVIFSKRTEIAATRLQEPKIAPVGPSRLRKADQFPARFGYQETTSDNGIRHLFQQQMIEAKRAGTWFRLRRQERGMFELALRLKVKLQSPDLLKALVSVLRSLREKCDRGFMALMWATKIAWAYSEAAFRWGNPAAKSWRSDQAYIRYLSTQFQGGPR